MAVLYPDILEHNNVNNYALVDATSLRGNVYPIDMISSTGSIVDDKRKIGMLVFASSSQALYGFFGQTTSSTDWNTTSNWKAISTGSGGGGGSTFPYTGSAIITGSLTVIGNTISSGDIIASSNITHNFNEFKTIYTNVGTSTSASIFTFEPAKYYSCFIEHHVFLYDGGTTYASRAGNIRISVPYDYASLDGLYNIPFVENSTEWYTDTTLNTTTTEDISFKVNYNNTATLIEVWMYNDNPTYLAYINAEYRLIGLKT